MSTYSVAIFCNREHRHTVTRVETVERAEAIACGVHIGSNMCGAVNVATYILPTDMASMRTEQDPKEVSKVR